MGGPGLNPRRRRPAQRQPATVRAPRLTDKKGKACGNGRISQERQCIKEPGCACNGDVVGRDTAGQTIIQLSVPDDVLDTLMTFDPEAAELEDGGDGEPDADAEEDGPPVVVEFVRPKLVERRRALASSCVD
jgi:hypothetical protein